MYELNKLQEEKLLLELKDKKTKNSVKTVCANYKVVIESLFNEKEKNEKKS